MATGDSHGWAAVSTLAPVTSTFVGALILTMLPSSSMPVNPGAHEGPAGVLPPTAAAVTAQINPPTHVKVQL